MVYQSRVVGYGVIREVGPPGGTLVGSAASETSDVVSELLVARACRGDANTSALSVAGITVRDAIAAANRFKNPTTLRGRLPIETCPYAITRISPTECPAVEGSAIVVTWTWVHTVLGWYEATLGAIRRQTKPSGGAATRLGTVGIITAAEGRMRTLSRQPGASTSSASCACGADTKYGGIADRVVGTPITSADFLMRSSAIEVPETRNAAPATEACACLRVAELIEAAIGVRTAA